MSSIQGFFARLLRTSARLAVTFCVLSLMFEAGVAQAQTVFSVGGIKYKTLTDSSAQVGDGLDHAADYGLSTITIPATVAFNGKNFPKHAFDPLIHPFLPGNLILQECIVAASLDFRQIWDYVRGSEAAKATCFLGLKPSLSRGGHKGSPS